MSIVNVALNTTSDTFTTLTSSITSGNAVIFGVYLSEFAAQDIAGGGAGLSGASDSQPDVLFDDVGNAYTLLADHRPLDATYELEAAILFYGKANITNSPTTWSLYHSSYRQTGLILVELSGRGTSLVVDSGVNFKTPFSGSTDIPSAYTTTADNVDVISFYSWAGASDQTFVQGTSHTLVGTSLTGRIGAVARNCATATSYTSTCATLGATIPGAGAIIGIKAAAGASSRRKLVSTMMIR